MANAASPNKTLPSNEAYREGWERIFGKKPKAKRKTNARKR